VSFAQNPAIIADQVDAEYSSVFELEGEWKTDPIAGVIGRIKIDGAFDAVKAGDRKTGVIDESLVTSNRVFDSAQSCSIQDQFSAAGKFFDKFKHLRLITRLSRTIQ
jgi:hypothetical protein